MSNAQTKRRNITMGKLLVILISVGLLGAAGLYGYSFALRADPQPQSHQVTLGLE